MLKFRILLWSIGVLLWTASRTSGRVQSQLSRDMLFSVGTEDGVWRTYQFANRRISSRAGASDKALLTLIFRTGDIGFRILLASNTIDQLVDGLGTGDVVCKGEAAHVLWFYELIMGLKPWQRPKLETWPDSYTEPNLNHKVADRIKREPVTAELDPNWQEAFAQREKTILWRVGRGATPEGKFKEHRIVVDEGSNGAFTS